MQDGANNRPQGGDKAAGGEGIVVEGVVERVTFESATSSFRVFKLNVAGRSDRLSIVGVLPPVAVGARVRVRGRLEQDRRHGEQLRAESLIELAPATLGGLQKYLASGLIPGVGTRIAQRIVAAFGLDTLRVLDEEPHRLAEVLGLGTKRRLAVERAWRDQRALRDVMVFLQAHGTTAALAARIVRRYGGGAMAVVSREPYRLARDVRGVGFKTADRIALALGIARDSPERLEAGVLQAVHDATESGHVWTASQEVVGRAAQLLSLADGDDSIRRGLEHAIRAASHRGSVALEPLADRDDGEVAVQEADLHAAEVRVAERLRELVSAPARPLDRGEEGIRSFEGDHGVELAPEQKRAVCEAALRPVLVVTGGPGVGKTTLVRALLQLFLRSNIDVRLAAPTGRASKRMSEATGVEATTLHRLLEFEPKSGAFRRDRRNPLVAGAVVVDEASMLDLPLADALTQALAPGTRLVLVGDVDQLPSVGPGAVLRDAIASGIVPYVRLEHIFRQAAQSLIVTNAHRINRGLLPVAGKAAEGESTADFFIVERREPIHARDTLVELVKIRIPQRFGFDPVRDVQVLTPMNRGPAGALAINQALQEALNPRGPSVERGARVYRAGDKVMQLRNDYDRGVYNGDVGTVASVDEDSSSLVVRFDEREVAFEAGALDDLTLSYACTVHKAQGSEYPAVVIPLLTSHFVMLSKNLLYTAVTRGKRLVVLVADPRAIDLALSSRRGVERRTGLTARLTA